MPAAIPVTIRGDTFSSFSAAGRYLNLNPSSIRQAYHEGRLETVGLKWKCEVEIGDTVYESISAVARAYNVSKSAVWECVERGTQNNIGSRKNVTVTIRNKTYDSPLKAAKGEGVHVDTIYRHRKNGTLDKVGIEKKSHWKKVFYQGKWYDSQRQLASALKVPYSTVNSAIARGVLQYWEPRKSENTN